MNDAPTASDERTRTTGFRATMRPPAASSLANVGAAASAVSATRGSGRLRVRTRRVSNAPSPNVIEFATNDHTGAATASKSPPIAGPITIDTHWMKLATLFAD